LARRAGGPARDRRSRGPGSAARLQAPLARRPPARRRATGAVRRAVRRAQRQRRPARSADRTPRPHRPSRLRPTGRPSPTAGLVVDPHVSPSLRRLSVLTALALTATTMTLLPSSTAAADPPPGTVTGTPAKRVGGMART